MSGTSAGDVPAKPVKLKAGTRLPAVALGLRLGELAVDDKGALVFQRGRLRVLAQPAGAGGPKSGQLADGADVLGEIHGQALGHGALKDGQVALAQAVEALGDKVAMLAGIDGFLSGRHELIRSLLKRITIREDMDVAQLVQLFDILQPGWPVAEAKAIKIMEANRLRGFAYDMGVPEGTVRAWLDGRKPLDRRGSATLQLMVREAKDKFVGPGECVVFPSYSLGRRTLVSRNPDFVLRGHSDPPELARLGALLARMLFNMETLGDPRFHDHYYGPKALPEMLRRATIEIMESLAELSERQRWKLLEVEIGGEPIRDLVDWFNFTAPSVQLADVPPRARIIEGHLRLQLYGTGDDPGYRATAVMDKPDEIREGRIVPGEWAFTLDMDGEDIWGLSGLRLEELPRKVADEMEMAIQQQRSDRVAAKEIILPAPSEIPESRMRTFAQDLDALCRRHRLFLRPTVPGAPIVAYPLAGFETGFSYEPDEVTNRKSARLGRLAGAWFMDRKVKER